MLVIRFVRVEEVRFCRGSYGCWFCCRWLVMVETAGELISKIFGMRVYVGYTLFRATASSMSILSVSTSHSKFSIDIFNLV